MMNYLDKTGLGLVWAKIKSIIPTSVSSLTNDSGYQTATQVDELIETALSTYANGDIAEYGVLLSARTAAAMIDTDKLYVYTGSEAGYTYGDWYYYNGTQWVSGGTYKTSDSDYDLLDVTEDTLYITPSSEEIGVVNVRSHTLLIN